MGNIVAISALVVVFTAIITKLIIDKKKGRTCSSCSGCSKANFCTDKK